MLMGNLQTSFRNPVRGGGWKEQLCKQEERGTSGPKQVYRRIDIPPASTEEQAKENEATNNVMVVFTASCDKPGGGTGGEIYGDGERAQKKKKPTPTNS